MESLSSEIERYLSRPADDWRDHQRVLPWGSTPSALTDIALSLGVDASTVCRWQKAISPIPVEAAFRMARTCGAQYLSYLADKNRLNFIPVRTLSLQGALMDTFARLQAEQSRVLPLLAKVDRGEQLTKDEIMEIARWKALAIELTQAIANAAMEGTHRE